MSVPRRLSQRTSLSQRWVHFIVFKIPSYHIPAVGRARGSRELRRAPRPAGRDPQQRMMTHAHNDAHDDAHDDGAFSSREQQAPFWPRASNAPCCAGNYLLECPSTKPSRFGQTTRRLCSHGRSPSCRTRRTRRLTPAALAQVSAVCFRKGVHASRERGCGKGGHADPARRRAFTSTRPPERTRERHTREQEKTRACACALSTPQGKAPARQHSARGGSHCLHLRAGQRSAPAHLRLGSNAHTYKTRVNKRTPGTSAASGARMRLACGESTPQEKAPARQHPATARGWQSLPAPAPARQRSAASGARRHLHHGSKRSRQWAACGGPPVVPLTHAPGLQHAAASASAPAPAPAPAPRSGMLAPDCSTSARGVVFGPERNVVFGFHCEHMRWGAGGRGGS